MGKILIRFPQSLVSSLRPSHIPPRFACLPPAQFKSPDALQHRMIHTERGFTFNMAPSSMLGSYEPNSPYRWGELGKHLPSHTSSYPSPPPLPFLRNRFISCVHGISDSSIVIMSFPYKSLPIPPSFLWNFFPNTPCNLTAKPHPNPAYSPNPPIPGYCEGCMG